VRGIRRSIGGGQGAQGAHPRRDRQGHGASHANTLKGTRDRALLLLRFPGAFRRSEFVALDVADLEETEDGFRVTIRRSKTDQEGQGQTVAIMRGGLTTQVHGRAASLCA